jgi:hypothetical protein
MAEEFIEEVSYERPYQPQHQQTRSERIQHLIHATQSGISLRALKSMEHGINGVWTQYGIYFVLTGTHFLEQITRKEHANAPITIQELSRMLRSFTSRFDQYLASFSLNREHYGVIVDSLSAINIGFVLRPGVGLSGYPRDLMLQTILRKHDFTTQDRTYEV